MNWAPAGIPPRALREVYLHPFEAAVRVAGARSVMNAYNEIDGILCAADRESPHRDAAGRVGVRRLRRLGLLLDPAARRLPPAGGGRGERRGAGARGRSRRRAAGHRLLRRAAPARDRGWARRRGDARRGGAARAVHEVRPRPLRRAVRRRRRRVRRRSDGRPIASLRARSPARASCCCATTGSSRLAAEVGSIAVIGPNADTARNLFGDYAYPAHVESLQNVLDSGRSSLSTPGVESAEIDPVEIEAPSVLDALRARYGSRVSFARGLRRQRIRPTPASPRRSSWPRPPTSRCMVMGDKSGLTEDCTSGEFRDRASFDLPGVQEELVRAVVATGTPVVLVLVAGRPSASAWLHEQCAAVVMAWLPGEEGAGAIADVLSGETNPGGKLPISYPRAVGQVPVFYAHKASGGRSHPVGDYVDESASAALPVRSRPQLHDVRAVRAADRRGDGAVDGRARRRGAGDQHGRAGG